MLPRARGLTDALVAAPGPVIDEAFALELRADLTAAFSGHVVPEGERRRVTVNGYMLRVLLGAAPADHGAFRWSPRTTRRALGLAAVRDCVRGECRTPAEAVRQAAAEAMRLALAGGSGPRSAGAWLATVSAGGRAVVEAEAVTWATALLGALEWERFSPSPQIGGPDRWWDVPGGRGMALQGRAEVRARAHGHPVLLCVGNGHPVSSSRAELLLPALVEVLHTPHTPPPARVVGWWPASGRTLVVPVDHRGLRETARAVGEGAAALGSS